MRGLTLKWGSSLTPMQFFACVFGLSSLGSIAAELQSGRKITGRSVFGAALYSGMTGVTIALLLYSRYGESNPYLLLGIASTSGIGSVNVAHIIIKALIPAIQQALLAVLKPKSDDK